MALESERVEFKIKRNNVIIDGLFTLNHEKETYSLIYYDFEGLKYYNIPENPFKKSDVKYNDYETIKNKFHLDFLVYDLLTDYSKENNIHIILKDYELFINP